MQRIAIIGGGAAGAAVVGEFLRRGSDLELVWLAGRSPPGRGVAYATTHGAHLLNVRASNMGLFADDVGGLVRYLQERGVAFDPADIVLIGDTPLDVAAAIEGGARAVGVATGPYETDELKHSGADAVLADLSDLELVLEAVLG